MLALGVIGYLMTNAPSRLAIDRLADDRSNGGVRLRVRRRFTDASYGTSVLYCGRCARRMLAMAENGCQRVDKASLSAPSEYGSNNEID